MLNRMTIVGLATSCLTLALIATSGCASRGGILGVDGSADIPAGAIPEPAGAKVCEWQTAQVTGAAADQTVFYRADFIGNSAKISPDAISRIARNASSGLATSQPSIIEPSGDEAVDAARITAVSLQLASYGITQPMVEVAIPAALGLRGIQAERIANGIGNTRTSSFGSGIQPMGIGGALGGTFPGAIY